jgi:hypothetical protein
MENGKVQTRLCLYFYSLHPDQVAWALHPIIIQVGDTTYTTLTLQETMQTYN